MSAAFTPGPWSIFDDDGLKVTAPDGDAEPWHVAHICGACGHEEDASEANAYLIAAAPELYEALTDARRIIAEELDCMVECATVPPEHDRATLDPMTKPYVEEYDTALAKIDAALAKARGEQ